MCLYRYIDMYMCVFRAAVEFGEVPCLAHLLAFDLEPSCSDLNNYDARLLQSTQQKCCALCKPSVIIAQTQTSQTRLFTMED